MLNHFICFYLKLTAAKQMRERIVQLVLDSFGDQFYGKALDCVKALRVEAIKVEIPPGYPHDCLLNQCDGIIVNFVLIVSILSKVSRNTFGVLYNSCLWLNFYCRLVNQPC